MSFRFGRKNSSKQNKRLQVETLEPRVVLDASVIISEFMASNDDILLDEDGEDSDWIELLNVTPETVNLNGWHLTDDPDDLNKWTLPEVSLNPGEHLLVFASGKDRDNPLGTLHANFSLSASGEYLAVTRPDQSVDFEIAPGYPRQVTDISYGIPNGAAEQVLLPLNSPAQVLVPTNDALEPEDLASGLIAGSWLDPALDTAAWIQTTTGVGFYDDSENPNPKPGDGTVIANSTTEFNSFQTLNNWRYGYWEASSDEDSVYSVDDFDAFSWTGLSTVSPFNHWDGTKWDLAVAPNLPNTEMRSDGARTSGTNSSDVVHHPIRRWTSEVTGSILVSGTLNDLDSAGDGVIARILLNGNEVYSQAINGNMVSYSRIMAVQQDDIIDFVIDPGPAQNDVGDNTEFTVLIEDITAIVGPDGGLPTIADDISGDIGSAMQGQATSAYVRIPFQVAEGNLNSLLLNIQYDDGFVAYLNGQEIAARNAPELPAWNSTSLEDRPAVDATAAESINVTDYIDLLVPGTENVLMIHAFNSSIDSGDLLILPELVATNLQIELGELRYFVTPTPGESNGLGSADVGPVFYDRTHSPHVPGTTDAIVVTANAAETFAGIAKVDLHYRVMYDEEAVISMADDGSGNDAAANDGIYTATIPAGIATDGQMVRWYMTAEDVNGQVGRFPRFEDTRNQEEYFGTIVQDVETQTNLPHLHWFVESRARAMSGGTYGSLWYNGEFYDNVRFSLHGQSSSGFSTVKKSMNVNLPDDHRFTWNPDEPQMKKFNLLTNYADKSKLRNTLGYEQRKIIGDPYHLAESVRVNLNGEFFAVYDFVEDGDNRWLERLGMDPEGALYKMYNDFGTATGEKKTRRDENTQDLRDAVAGTRLTGDDSNNFLFDNFNIPAMVNYLVGFAMTSNRDCCHKNYYAYRDTNGTGEWQFMPWDVDLSQGRNWVGGLAYFDDTITYTNPLFLSNNQLINDLYATDGFRDMYLRRLRTVMDAYVKPPGTPYEDLPLETRVDELVQYMWDDAQLDNDKNPSNWGQTGFQTFQEATDIIKNEYSAPRREWLYSQVQPDTSHITVLLSGDVGALPLKYLVPSDNSLGNSWTAADFNDASWSDGTTGIGLETATRGGYEDLLGTNIEEEMIGRTSVFVRSTFNLDSLDDIDELTLRMKFDDGFIAYINGVEVHRENIDEGVSGFDITASGNSDRFAVEYENFDISNFISTLRVGENVLAIQAVNQSATSNDMLMIPEIVEGIVSNSTGEIPAAQNGNPNIEITELDFNPVSGNQDEEYVKLTNNNSFAVDISGWTLTGGVDMTFRPGTVLPSGWSVYAVADAKSFRARAEGPSGNQGLFVHGNYEGSLSNYGETLVLSGSDGAEVTSFTYEGQPTVTQESLRITEIMYNPLGPSAPELAINPEWTADDFEFIELQNTSATEALDLTGVTFVGGIDFTFTDSQITSLGPGARVLVVQDLAAFTARYDAAAVAKVAGEFANFTGLRNSQETIKLNDATGSTVQEFDYSDDVDRGWSFLADGNGASLEVVSTGGDYGSVSNWQGSQRIGGTPGTTDSSAASALMINEVHARTDAPDVDAIELYNSGSQPLALNQYFLGDAADSIQSLAAYQIPSTTLPAGGYLVIRRDDLGFGLSGSGDQVYLTQGTATGPTHFVDAIDYPALQAGRTYGRSPNGADVWTQLSSPTLGAENAAPFVDSVIIAEVNYHPAAPSAAALAIDPTLDRNDLEFVELHNRSNAAVDVSQWRIRGDVGFDFPAGTVLAAGDSLVVTRFNPANPENAVRLSAFMSHYGLNNANKLIGGFSGSLNDGGDRVTLQRSELVEGVVEHVLADQVRFTDSIPWPIAADGQGASLNRTAADVLGDSPISWVAASPTPTAANFGGSNPADFNGDGQLTAADIDLFGQALRSPNPAAQFDLNGDGQVNEADRDELILNRFGTTYGDSNLDGRFNSADLVAIFVAGEFEDGIAGNSGWAEGDWNLDGDFGTGDLVAAFVAGGYQANAVPQVQLHDIAFADLDDDVWNKPLKNKTSKQVDDLVADLLADRIEA